VGAEGAAGAAPVPVFAGGGVAAGWLAAAAAGVPDVGWGLFDDFSAGHPLKRNAPISAAPSGARNVRSCIISIPSILPYACEAICLSGRAK
jgi:hypothetical protein